MTERIEEEDAKRRGARASNERRAEHRRASRRGLGASAILHIAIFLAAWIHDPEPPSPFAAAGPDAGDDRAAAGGGMEAIELRSEPARPEIPPPPLPVPVPEIAVEIEPEPIAEPVDYSELAGALADAATGDSGTDDGPGTETGTGEGDGGTEDDGRARGTPPTPRGLILPPADRPGRVRGKEVTVWVFVTEDGVVVPDSTRVRPSSGDRKFDDRLRRQAAEWVFQPAQRRGQSIAEWFRYVITL